MNGERGGPPVSVESMRDCAAAEIGIAALGHCRIADADLWFANLAHVRDDCGALCAVLDGDERSRARRFLHADARRRFELRRALLRLILASCVEQPAASLTFEYGPHGRPRLGTARKAIDFNLSHSGDCVLYAVRPGGRVGVDIERVRPLADARAIAEQFFSPAERHQLKSVRPHRRDDAFFACWTRKEAFVKAVGDGLTFPLSEFAVTANPDEPARLLSVRGDWRAADGWVLRDVQAGPGLRAALAIEHAR